jgi:DNA replication and repair protein RecF
MTGSVTFAAFIRLTLTDFRSYARTELSMTGAPVFLVGPNGAGKTNLLEAISFFAPGRGLRGASLAEVGRRLPGETGGRAWAVAAELAENGEPLRLGTGVEQAGASRRTVRLEGETVPPGRLAEHVRQVWLTPAQDRLFLEGASDRRKFFDRLVFAAEPRHAAHVAAYEKTLRERMRLLTEGPADPAWLDALEARLAEAGALMADARARTLAALQAEIDDRGERPFPQARLGLVGPWEQMALEGASLGEIAPRLAAALAAGRERDAAAGRGLTGPHRGDLLVVHAEKDRPAAECSTGEQKALILNLVLAQAARLARAEGQPSPILLLDEVAAHLDRRRRAALFDEIEALGLQAFLTGTDEHLFEELVGRAQGVRVEGSGFAEI